MSLCWYFFFCNCVCFHPISQGRCDTPGSMRGRLTLVAWVSGSAHHWLTMPTISVPPLPQHIPWTDHTAGRSLHGCIGFLIPPLEILNGHRWWQAQATDLLLHTLSNNELSVHPWNEILDQVNFDSFQCFKWITYSPQNIKFLYLGSEIN